MNRDHSILNARLAPELAPARRRLSPTKNCQIRLQIAFICAPEGLVVQGRPSGVSFTYPGGQNGNPG